ncbi:MAG: acyltransferase family protein [Cellvibrio sp.]|nr:acyltransferase family protein [Cellvibrio sp.]
MRVCWIDFLRVISAVAIVVIHSASPYFAGAEPTTVHWWAANVFISVGKTMGPAMFVMISGYVLMNKKIPYLDFYKSRVRRLLAPLVFWSLFIHYFLLYLDGSTADFFVEN